MSFCNVYVKHLNQDPEISGDCELDEDNGDHRQQIYAFLEVPTFISVISYNSSEPVYIIKVVEKGEAKQQLNDRYGHVISPGELFLKASYLSAARSKKINQKQFNILKGDVYCSPDEVFEVFLEIDDNLSMAKNIYTSLLARATSTS